MEESYLQSMDPGLHQGRLQDRFQNSSSPSVPGDLFRISSPPTATKVTYSRPPGSGSYHPGSSSPAVHRPLLKTFLCKEARRVDEDNHQLKVSEQVGDVLQVQDGVNKILHSSDPSRCSPLHIGPQGCVLPHPHTSPTPSVLKVCGQVRKGDLSLPVPVPAVRYLICPPPIHKGSIRNDGLPSPEYNYNRALPGRLLADSRLGSKIDGGHPPNLSPIQGLGVDRELPEIRLDTGHKKGIPRHSPGYKNTTLISSREKTDQSETKDRVVQKEENPLDQGSHADPGSDDLLHLNSTLGPIPLQNPPECSFDSLEQRPPFSKLQDENIGKSDKIPVLVDRTRESGERSPVEFDSSHNRHHGRESEWLGGARGPASLPGFLGPSRQDKILKLPGTEGSAEDSDSSQTSPQGSTCQDPIRQHYYGMLSKKTGRYQMPAPSGSSRSNLHMGRKGGSVHFSNPSKGVSELESRLPKPSQDRRGRMESEQTGLQTGLPAMGLSRNRPLRIQGKFSTGLFLLTKPQRKPSGSRRLSPELGHETGLRFSSFSPNPGSPKEDEDQYHHSDPGRTRLVQESLVSHLEGNVDQRPVPPSRQERSVNAGTSGASQSQQAETDCLDPERQTLRKKGLSNQEERFHCLDVRRTVLAYIKRTKSWRKSANLLIQFGGRNKGSKASKTSLARWIKETIRECYRLQSSSCPITLRAHSTRAMSATWAEKAGASIDQICRAATWSSSTTFVRHYRLDSMANQDLAFGRKVLQAVVPP
ncbi:uncharacterized protein LOC122920201 [Bufo gargarizans]|uniref:uncharacterized protein LOC122920201 n=2 Tax=Bufo gargarizans TaxID=30331 RepID=UPI001CF1CAEC|nr:uncharacterized protein LOC122920201 [Bufo gargarizans]